MTLRNCFAFTCVFATASLPALAAAPTIAAAPMHSSGVNVVYPRLTKFPDAKAMSSINALLAAQEKTDRDSKADCYSQLKDAKQKPDANSFNEDITVTYLSGRYMTVNVLASYYCGGPYPTNGAEQPLTFDLGAGKAVDWTVAFKPGFLPADSGPPAFLTKLYRARYSKAKADADCLGVITDQDPFSGAPIVWLDAKGGVVFQPDFPHVTAACAVPLTLTPAEIAPWLKDTKLAADLKATVHK